MARIRSVHPSLFTDDDFMELSSEAALLLIGLWTEAYDDGVFAWKPNGIKARILPAKNVEVAELLLELVENGFLKRFEHGGKPYGAIRNFRKFQRPKKPNSSEVLPNELRTYVGLTDDSSEPVRNQSATAPEILPQMEDGGDKMEEKRKEDKPRSERALIVEILSKVISEDRVKALIDHRRKKKAPINPHIAGLIVDSLSQAQDPNAAADEMMFRGWQAWRPDWSDLPKVNGSTGPPQGESQAEQMRRQLEQEAQSGQPDRDHPTPH